MAAWSRGWFEVRRREFLGAAAAAALQGQPATRPFRMGFTPFPHNKELDGFVSVYEALARYADTFALFAHDGIPWPQALETTDIAAYPESLRISILLHKSIRDALIPRHPMYLVMNVINHQEYNQIAPLWADGPDMALPDEWAALPFNHVNVKRAALNFFSALIGFFEPAYFTFAVEINILFSRRPEIWAEYSELHRFLYRGLKERFPTLPVCYSLHHENMLGLGTDAENLLRRLNQKGPELLINAVAGLRDATDCLAISTYPFMVPGLATPDGFYDLALLLGYERNLPMFVEQTGYASRPFLVGDVTVPGSDEAQTAFLSFLLAKARQHDFRFVINWVPRDFGTAHGDGLFNRVWASTGLLDLEGTPKPAMKVWEDYRAQPLIAGR
jgi:hypothetical protein